MNSADVFYGISDFLTWTYQFYDMVGNSLNNLFLFTGFFGFGFWMYWQKKFNDIAANNPDQIK